MKKSTIYAALSTAAALETLVYCALYFKAKKREALTTSEPTPQSEVKEPTEEPTAA